MSLFLPPPALSLSSSGSFRTWRANFQFNFKGFKASRQCQGEKLTKSGSFDGFLEIFDISKQNTPDTDHRPRNSAEIPSDTLNTRAGLVIPILGNGGNNYAYKTYNYCGLSTIKSPHQLMGGATYMI